MAADHLDATHRYELTVSHCLPVAAERFGVDYRDQGTVRDLVTEVTKQPFHVGFVSRSKTNLR